MTSTLVSRLLVEACVHLRHGNVVAARNTIRAIRILQRARS